MRSPGEVRIRKNSLTKKEPYMTLWPNLPILSPPLLLNSAQSTNSLRQSSTSRVLNRREPLQSTPQGSGSWQTKPIGTRVLRKHSSDSDLRIKYEEQSPLFQMHPKDTKSISIGLSGSEIRSIRRQEPSEAMLITQELLDSVQIEIEDTRGIHKARLEAIRMQLQVAMQSAILDREESVSSVAWKATLLTTVNFTLNPNWDDQREVKHSLHVMCLHIEQMQQKREQKKFPIENEDILSRERAIRQNAK